MPPVSPYLTVRDVTKAVGFYERAFGFKRRMIVPGQDGKPMHAEMTHGESVVMMGPETDESKGPGSLGGSPVTLYVYFENVDKVATQAKQAGGNLASGPKDEFWGDRVAIVIDPDGHRWMLATFKKLVPLGELKPAGT